MIYKQYLLFRQDLACSVGKRLIHAAHNSMSAFTNKYTKCLIPRNYIPRVKDWLKNGHQTKIALSVGTLEEMKRYFNAAYNADLPAAMISDKGFYELDRGTIVCCAIGPITEDETKKLGLKELKLYK